MLTGACTLMGSYHDKNQDSHLAYNYDFGSLIVSSDGLGSCLFSEIGSQLACHAAEKIVKKYRGVPDDVDTFLKEIHAEWLSGLEQRRMKVSDCYATLLFCFVGGDRIFAARVGDGFAGIMSDGQCNVLFDNKDGHLINETLCLTEEFFPEDWEVLDVDADVFDGAICCSDGILVDPITETNYCAFLSGFMLNYIGMGISETVTDIQGWLPDIQDTDDKTIAFMLRDTNE